MFLQLQDNWSFRFQEKLFLATLAFEINKLLFKKSFWWNSLVKAKIHLTEFAAEMLDISAVSDSKSAPASIQRVWTQSSYSLSATVKKSKKLFYHPSKTIVYILLCLFTIF